MPKAQVAEFYRRLAALNPEPQGELNFVNPYTLLVAVALSAQATDVSVNKATERLFQDVKTPQAMVALGEEGLKEHIKTIGLYNSKAKNVIKLSEILLSEYGGKYLMIRLLWRNFLELAEKQQMSFAIWPLGRLLWRSTRISLGLEIGQA